MYLGYWEKTKDTTTDQEKEIPKSLVNTKSMDNICEHSHHKDDTCWLNAHEMKVHIGGNGKLERLSMSVFPENTMWH